MLVSLQNWSVCIVIDRWKDDQPCLRSVFEVSCCSIQRRGCGPLSCRFKTGRSAPQSTMETISSLVLTAYLDQATALAGNCIIRVSGVVVPLSRIDPDTDSIDPTRESDARPDRI